MKVELPILFLKFRERHNLARRLKNQQYFLLSCFIMIIFVEKENKVDMSASIQAHWFNKEQKNNEIY